MTKLKASFIKFPEKAHQFKKYGCVVVHDADAKFSATQFDFRYMGARSKFGKYIRQLEKEGVDIREIGAIQSFTKAHGEPDELTMRIAKRLFEVMGKRTILVKTVKDTNGNYVPIQNGPVLGKGVTLTKTEKFDWKKPAAKHTKYYKMAEYLLAHYDQNIVMSIVDVIAGYA